MIAAEFEAGPDHTIVVYAPDDIGMELNAVEVFGEVAADAAERAKSGLHLLSMTAMPLRHAGTAFGAEGSGYETKVAIGAVYERWPVAKG